MSVVADGAGEGVLAADLVASAVLRPAPGVAAVMVGTETVVHRVDPPASFVLDAMAGVIWRCLDGASPVGEILDDLADALGAQRDRVREDCVATARIWLGQRLVEDVRDE